MTNTTIADGESLFDDLRHAAMDRVREAIRSGRYQGHTAGIGLGRLQGNLVILPAEDALDFFRFCQRNPKPCPLVGVSDTGDPMMHTLGDDIDIRRDVPLYNIYRDGTLDRQQPDIDDVWRDDLVAFVLGCSFTFEKALMAAHVDRDPSRGALPWPGGRLHATHAHRRSDPRVGDHRALSARPRRTHSYR